MILTDLTILQAHQGLKKKEFSAVELCRAHFDNIKRSNKEFFAFLFDCGWQRFSSIGRHTRSY